MNPVKDDSAMNQAQFFNYIYALIKGLVTYQLKYRRFSSSLKTPLSLNDLSLTG